MAVANSPSFLHSGGPLARAYSSAKREMIGRLDSQETKIAVNRAQLKDDFPVANKLLAVVRSRKNLVLELTPLTSKSETGQFGKRGEPIKSDK